MKAQTQEALEAYLAAHSAVKRAEKELEQLEPAARDALENLPDEKAELEAGKLAMATGHREWLDVKKAKDRLDGRTFNSLLKKTEYRFIRVTYPPKQKEAA